MTQEATEDLFDTHQKYVNAIQRLPLFPQVVNIDRLREEHNPDLTIKHHRSTRAWANSLLTPEGKSLQCDAENGGNDKKAYLLVPSQLLSVVQPLLQRYKRYISATGKAQSSQVPGSTRDRPDEIYIPTASVQRNVDFLKSMSAAAIWKNAPSAIRQGTRSPSFLPGKVSDTISKQTDIDHATNMTSTNTTPIRQGNSSPTVTTNPAPDYPSRQHMHSGLNSRQPNQPYVRPLDDNTTATFHSTASTTLNSSQHAQRFSELEASIKANQQDIRNMTKQHETMDVRLLETMSSCHENTKQLVNMQGQLNKLQSTMQTIAEQMNQLTNHFIQQSQHDNASTHQRSPAKKKPRQAPNADTPSQSPMPVQHSEVNIPNLIAMTSPTESFKHEDMNKTHNPSNDAVDRPHQETADQEEAQYNAPSSPGTAMEE